MFKEPYYPVNASAFGCVRWTDPESNRMPNDGFCILSQTLCVHTTQFLVYFGRSLIWLEFIPLLFAKVVEGSAVRDFKIR